MISFPELLLLGLIFFNLLFLFTVLTLTDLFFSRTQQFQSSSFCPPVSVIVPVKGMDDGLYENVKALCSQDYPCTQVIFVAAEPEDPAIPVIQQVIKECTSVDVRLVVSSQKLGTNEKVSNLENGYQKSKYDYVVFTDSDIRVGTDYLKEVIAPLSDDRIGLVTCLPFCRDSRNIPAALETVGINSHIFFMYIPIYLLGRMNYGTGATMAMSRRVFEDLGGFQRVADAVAEDAAIGQLIKGKGLLVYLSSYIVHSVHVLDTWKGYFCHTLRWNRTIYAVVPLAYTTFVLFFGTFYALLYWILNLWTIWAFLVFVFVTFVRIALTAYYNESYIKDPSTQQYLWLVPLRDLLIPLEWLCGFAGRTISWRGNRFRIQRGARIQRIP